MRETGSSAATTEDFELGRAALLEITSAESIGAPAGSIAEDDGVTTLYFDTTMAGYLGWRWTVSLFRGDGAEPSVLETELTPGDGALLSPDWVPWADRLAEYKEAQAELAAQGLDADSMTDDDDTDDDDTDDDDDHDDDFDDDDLLHAGDLDGVDLDEDDSEELASPAVGDHEAEEPKGQSDDTSPQPPRVPRRSQRGKKQQQHDEGN